MSKTDDNYIGILLEEIRDQNKVVLEAVGDMQADVRKIQAIEENIEELKSDMKVVKAAVTDISKQDTLQNQRITHLEVA